MSKASDDLFQRINIQEMDLVSADSIPSKTANRATTNGGAGGFGSVSTAPDPVVSMDSSSLDTWIGDEILWAVMEEGDIAIDTDWMSIVAVSAPATDNFEFWAWHDGSIMGGEGISSNLDQEQAGAFEFIL